MSNRTTRLPVYLIPQRDEKPYNTSNLRSIGLRCSKRLVQTTNPDTENVWVVNYLRIPSHQNKCEWLIHHVQQSKRRRKLQMLIYDISDLGRTEIDECIQTLSVLLGARHIHIKYARRNLVQGRDYSCFCMASTRHVPHCDHTCFNETAPLQQYSGRPDDHLSAAGVHLSKYIYNSVIAKYHIPVRSDLVQELKRITQYRKRNNVANTRPGDVAHFWNIQPHAWSGSLRNRVSQALLSLNSNMSVLADTVSPRSTVGRNTVDSRYAQALLDYKIVVVAQRDDWEDHMRLFEALVSGALVLSDPMMYMPCGYEDGVNIVIYNSIQDLKHKIMYYLNHPRERLKIARAGKTLALQQHLPVHQMERFLLGSWPTSSHNPVIPILE